MNALPSREPLHIVVNHRKVGKFALNVVVGALETDPETATVPVVFAAREDVLTDAVQRACNSADRVLVLWSFYSTGLRESVEELGRLRAAVPDPRVLHLAGGVHATAEPAQTLEAGFDLVAVGEGEQIIVDLVRALKVGTDWREVRGLAWRAADGTMHRNGKGAAVPLDDWPAFARAHNRFGPMEITRGCVFACSFCQTPFVNLARFRHRSVENILEHTRIMLGRGMRDYRFITPTALSYGAPDEGVNLPAVEELLARMREEIGPHNRLYYGTFPSEVRPEHVTEEALAILKRHVDNDNIIMGGQSGSQAVLDRVHRGHGVEDVRRAVRLCIAAGFVPNVDFLFGLPGETPEEREATRRFAEELTGLGARIHTHTFMPLPGTPLRLAEAGRLDRATQQTLRRLESTGQAYGQWKRQREEAVELSRLNREARERRLAPGTPGADPTGRPGT